MTYTLYLQIEDDSLPPPGQDRMPIRCAVICDQDDLGHALSDFTEAMDTLTRNGFDNLIELDT